jgi:hypothetical protein
MRKNSQGNLSWELVAAFSWPLQATLLMVAMAFRYTGESGLWLGDILSANGPIAWRPDELDWPGIPLILMALILVAWACWGTRESGQPTSDIGHFGTLLCLSSYAVSNGSSEILFSTLLGMWGCALAGLLRPAWPEHGSPTAMAGAVLVIACLLSPYLHFQKGVSMFEGGLVFLSALCGAASTGLPPSATKSARLAMPVWFSVLLLTAWWAGKTAGPSLRVLVALEMSAAFIVSRHWLLSLQQQFLAEAAQAEEEIDQADPR